MKPVYLALISISLFLYSSSSSLATVCRPTGADVSERLGGNYELYLQGHTASQQERDCMEGTRLEYLNTLIFAVGDLVPDATEVAHACKSLTYTRLYVQGTYRGNTFEAPGGTWIHGQPIGRLYSCPFYALRAFRTYLMASKTRNEAAERLANAPELRNVLDVNQTLTGPAEFDLGDKPEFDSARSKDFAIDTRKAFLPCGNGDCTDLAETDAVHMCFTSSKCERPTTQECQDIFDAGTTVDAAHVKYESGCAGDEDCEWFRRMQPFHGFQDTNTWNSTQLCQLADLEDVAHEAWDNAQLSGDPKQTEHTSMQHDVLHAMENDGQGWLVVFPGEGDPDKYSYEFGKLSPQDLLPELVNFYLSPKEL